MLVSEAKLKLTEHGDPRHVTIDHSTGFCDFLRNAEYHESSETKALFYFWNNNPHTHGTVRIQKNETSNAFEAVFKSLDFERFTICMIAGRTHRDRLKNALARLRPAHITLTTQQEQVK
ncbi:hypothetical protein C6499_19125 [Candidatus Poribacteria bacterium]|nr:MAG: hypothetical protein C6499_19125 [Candidatus Poribacteria bacterium]